MDDTQKTRDSAVSTLQSIKRRAAFVLLYRLQLLLLGAVLPACEAATPSDAPSPNAVEPTSPSSNSTPSTPSLPSVGSTNVATTPPVAPTAGTAVPPPSTSNTTPLVSTNPTSTDSEPALPSAPATTDSDSVATSAPISSPRERRAVDSGWKFTKDDPAGTGQPLAYATVKSWVLPTGNAFLADPGQQTERPAGNLGANIAYVSTTFDASAWADVDLPHDYAIAGPFTDSISSSMGRLPSKGVAWYRRALTIPDSDAGKSVFLDIDGAMSYSMVWVNGQFAGGWPYGYASYRVDITPFVEPGADNVIAIRLDNPTPAGTNWDDGSSRWYPGAGIYRHVWLVTTDPVHVAQWGTHLTTPEVTATSASVHLDVTVDNDTDEAVDVEVSTELFELDPAGTILPAAVSSIVSAPLTIPARGQNRVSTQGLIPNPKLWGPPPSQQPNRYLAVTTVTRNGEVADVYETRFGVRTLEFDGNAGLLVNGEHVKLNGVCNHHDLGALGSALSERALERQFQILAEMGTNAIRTAHNPPAPELLELADRYGFLIMDEAFDVWTAGKAKLDHHVFFLEWHEQDLRALLRRDRNHPSVAMWSIGNEIVEQNDATAGPAMAEKLTAICHQEDPTRPTVSGMNSAKPDNPFSGPIDSIGLNYQGTGVRSGPPQYPTYHAQFPDKFIVGTETVSTFSSRGVYTFPVATGRGQTASGSPGISGNQISSYDLYYADWSYAPDAEFESQDKYPYVGGEFVWTGFDYLGEPTPLDSVARSSYFGIIDLAGFKKDRFYLYQARWRPDLPMAHILPHWTWPEREGQVTPVHVYTSGDEAELFLNGESLGRRKKGATDYRLRWDDVAYEAGELGVVVYKGGAEWATETVVTAGAASQLVLSADRATLAADGRDLAFITLQVTDASGVLAPRATDQIHFEVSGAGALVATDNGDPTDRTVFQSATRKAFSGLALAIVRAEPETPGTITVTASANGLTSTSIELTSQ